MEKGSEDLQKRLRELQESLDVGGKDVVGREEYARYWKELIANNPGYLTQISKTVPQTTW